jgi:hypothetical protein
MTAPCQVTFSLDTAPLQAALDEFQLLLGQAGDRGLEFGYALAGRVQSGQQLVALQKDFGAAAGAAETVIAAYPSDGFLRLLAALRAGNFDALIVEQIFGHDGSVGGLDSPDDGGAPDGPQGLSGAAAPLGGGRP